MKKSTSCWWHTKERSLAICLLMGPVTWPAPLNGPGHLSVSGAGADGMDGPGLSHLYVGPLEAGTKRFGVARLRHPPWAPSSSSVQSLAGLFSSNCNGTTFCLLMAQVAFHGGSAWFRWLGMKSPHAWISHVFFFKLLSSDVTPLQK